MMVAVTHSLRDAAQVEAWRLQQLLHAEYLLSKLSADPHDGRAGQESAGAVVRASCQRIPIAWSVMLATSSSPHASAPEGLCAQDADGLPAGMSLRAWSNDDIDVRTVAMCHNCPLEVCFLPRCPHTGLEGTHT